MNVLDTIAGVVEMVPPLGVEVWAVILATVLVLRASLILVRGAGGAAWRTVTALLAGVLVVVWAASEGVVLRALPLHALAATVVALIAFERPHPEAAQLRLGRGRRRTPLPWWRALLLLAVTGAALAWLLMP